MKTLKLTPVLAAAVLVVALTLGATSANETRPASIPAERWIPIGANAGFALNTDMTTSTPKGALRPDQSIVAELYVKTAGGWHRARLENPVHATPLIR